MEFFFPLVLFLYECMWLPKVNLKITQVKTKKEKLKKKKKKKNWNANALAKWLYDGFDNICVKEIYTCVQSLQMNNVHSHTTDKTLLN